MDWHVSVLQIGVGTYHVMLSSMSDTLQLLRRPKRLTRFVCSHLVSLHCDIPSMFGPSLYLSTAALAQCKRGQWLDGQEEYCKVSSRQCQMRRGMMRSRRRRLTSESRACEDNNRLSDACANLPLWTQA